MILFVEDALLEAAATKIIAVKNPEIEITSVMGKKGFGAIHEKKASILRASSGIPFMVFLDSDETNGACLGDLINQWFGAVKPANIWVRFASLEVENWLLADRENISDYLSVSPAACPIVNDTFADAKEALVRLAGRSRSRAIREGMVPAEGHSSSVGPDYIPRMSEFIRGHWDVDAAAENNHSLARACREIAAIRL